MTILNFLPYKDRMGFTDSPWLDGGGDGPGGLAARIGRVFAGAGLPLTIVVIAHRSSTIMQADRIVVLDKGRIVEEGAPQGDVI